MKPSGAPFPIWLYVLSDLLSVYLSLQLLSLISDFRYTYPMQAGVCLYWSGWFLLTGHYQELYHRSRLLELARTLITIWIGLALLNILPIPNGLEQQKTLPDWIQSVFEMSLIQFGCIASGRMILLNHLKKQLTEQKIFFHTLLIGHADECQRLFDEQESHLRDGGFKCIGFLEPSFDLPSTHKEGPISSLGSIDQLEHILATQQVRSIILAPDKRSANWLEPTIDRLMNWDIEIRIVPDMLDILSGSVKTHSVLGTPLVEIYTARMPVWQKNVKRSMDVVLSLFFGLLLAPIMIWIAWKVKKDSPGPVFYRQERIGRKGRSFQLYKFRSMVREAETDGPALSSENDPRITPVGKTLRKWRLDELPQLWNILKGDMSIVGPRPERKYYIEQITRIHPYYRFLLQVKPGLTSWGMVQFGYAENIREMIERSRYDLLYLENLSLLLDIKIMLHTLRIIWKGSGK